MIRFNNDYNRTAHPRVWEVLQQAAQESHPGYGTDGWCARAEGIIRELTGQPEAAVWFFPGATQANFIVISAALSPVESVICAETGHIQCHEAASVEHVGHKLLALPATDGKITAEQIAECAAAYYEGGEPEYWTAPKLVYISFPTESGTLYSKAELEAIHSVCRTYGMYLFVDGARLGYGLGAEGNDVTVRDLAALADAFYFGGTKCGAMFGEAVVLTAGRAQAAFQGVHEAERRGARQGVAAGRAVLRAAGGRALFPHHGGGRRLALRVKAAFAERSIPFHVDSPTNQQFVCLTDAQAETLGARVHVRGGGPHGGRIAHRALLHQLGHH